MAISPPLVVPAGQSFGQTLSNSTCKKSFLNIHYQNSNKRKINMFVGLTSAKSICAAMKEETTTSGSHGIHSNLITLSGQNKLKEALEVLQIMDQRGILPDTNAYDSLFLACSNIKSLLYGKKVYAHMVRSGVQHHVYLETKVVNMFVKCGSLVDARQVFDKMVERNVYSWTAMINGYASQGHGEEALKLCSQMQQTGVQPDSYIFSSVLKACAGMGAIQLGKEIHGYVFRSGYELYVFVGNSLVDMYCKCGSLVHARQVFNKMPQRDAVSWNAMIDGYMRNGQLDEALELFLQMRLAGVNQDVVSWNSMIAGHGRNGCVGEALKFFRHMQSTGVRPNVISCNAMISCFTENGYCNEAMELFHQMQLVGVKPNVITWTTLIGGYARRGHSEKALEIFHQMQEAGGTQPDSFIYPTVLKACASLAALEQGKEIHGYIIRTSFDSDIFVDNAIIDMYAKCGNIEDARRVFDRISQRNVVTWNTMIAGYVQNGHVNEAEILFRQLLLTSIKPDVISWNTMIAGFSQNDHVDVARKLFHEMQLTGIKPNTISWNSLITGYALNGHGNDALKLFDQMQMAGVKQNAISWNALIAGDAQHGLGDRALKLFHEMQLAGMKPDSFTISSLIHACSQLGALEQGKETHGHAIRIGLDSNIIVGVSLVDMYGKCRVVQDARQVFNTMSVKNVVLWNAMITGYVQNRQDDEAFELFHQMQLAGIKMDAISWTAMITGHIQNGHAIEAFKLLHDMQLTGVKADPFTISNILSACANLAALEQGKEIHGYIIRSEFEQDLFVGSALVTMYAKCGRIEDAHAMFDKLSQKDVISWNAMIAGYAMYGHEHGQDALLRFHEMQ
eukprot:Gb_10768 [translate_table: standard]